MKEGRELNEILTAALRAVIQEVEERDNRIDQGIDAQNPVVRQARLVLETAETSVGAVTTVWVLRVSTREDEYLVGVYSTQEKAEAVAATLAASGNFIEWRTSQYVDITAMVVDETGKQWTRE